MIPHHLDDSVPSPNDSLEMHTEEFLLRSCLLDIYLLSILSVSTEYDSLLEDFDIVCSDPNQLHEGDSLSFLIQLQNCLASHPDEWNSCYASIPIATTTLLPTYIQSSMKIDDYSNWTNPQDLDPVTPSPSHWKCLQLHNNIQKECQPLPSTVCTLCIQNPIVDSEKSRVPVWLQPPHLFNHSQPISSIQVEMSVPM